MPLENLTGTEKGAGREIGTGVKIVATEMWMWIAKEIEETGIGTGTGTASVTAAMTGKDVVVIMEATETGGIGIGLDLLLEGDRGISLDLDLIQDLRLDRERKQVDLTWLHLVQLLFLVLEYQVCMDILMIWHFL